MGSGAAKEIDCVKPKTIFSRLEGFIDELEKCLNDFNNEEFETLEQFQNSKNKLCIEDIQKSSNEELYLIRQSLSKSNSRSDYDSKTNKLNDLEQKLQNLYMKNCEIITNKIQPFE